MLASLAPPVHLSGERIGLTLLVCVVSDFRRGHLEISWRSASDKEYTNIAPYKGAVTRKHRGHSAVAMITVVTSNWPSYSCSVHRKKHSKATKRPRVTSTGNASHSLSLSVISLIQQDFELVSKYFCYSQKSKTECATTMKKGKVKCCE